MWHACSQPIIGVSLLGDVPVDLDRVYRRCAACLSPMIPSSVKLAHIPPCFCCSRLQQISEAALKDNFDVVYQLLEEMLDSGSPLTTEPNLLRDVVLPPSLLNKVLSITGVSRCVPFSILFCFESSIASLAQKADQISSALLA